MGGQDSDKTEEPTEHKLQEQRKKGQVMKSQEVISTAGLLAAVGMLYAAGGFMWKTITEFTKKAWEQIPYYNFNERELLPELIWWIGTVALALAPLLAGVFIMAIIANVAQIKLLFTFEPLKPTLNKINPVEGFKRIFSMKSLMELFKQIAKLTIVGWICLSVVKGELANFMLAADWELLTTTQLVTSICMQIVKKVLIGMTVIAAVDYAFQYKQFMKQMKMSFQELKDEYKETEGNPQVKAKLRQLMRQGSQGRMMEEVPNSSAVVTNPTHLAIAIKYDKDESPVPTVVAKGEKLIAQQIKVLAEDHDVPIVENVELARALFGACEVGQAIPTELYKAVAEILAYVIKLKRKRQMRRQKRR
ncbi:MAG: flagellar biosynthesis protein FlhB [Candidatus Eremiobacteraeota bacterium]|nr:flagellar biosynthesis protein FlhB [Candidatus Eremiobacteraeota bacterium]